MRVTDIIATGLMVGRDKENDLWKTVRIQFGRVHRTYSYIISSPRVFISSTVQPQVECAIKNG